MANNGDKSLLRIQLENEAKNKEITDRDQIMELNKAMIEGKDLDKAAKTIFGPSPNKQPEKAKDIKVKKPNQIFYNAQNYH